MFPKYRCTLVVSHSKVKWYAQEIGQLLPKKKKVVYWHNKYLAIYNKLTIISLGQYKSEDVRVKKTLFFISNKTFIEMKMSMLPMCTGSVQRRQKNSPKVT